MNESNENYSWDPNKRELNVKMRGLDFVVLADFVFADRRVAIFDDEKPNKDGEKRQLAYAQVGDARLCLCFAERDGKKHLITIFKMHEKQWRKRYENKS